MNALFAAGVTLAAIALLAILISLVVSVRGAMAGRPSRPGLRGVWFAFGLLMLATAALAASTGAPPAIAVAGLIALTSLVPFVVGARLRVRGEESA